MQVLVDVRELPLSRKAGFSRRGLAAALEERGIRYMHMRELGTPRPMRQQLRVDRNYEKFFAQYTEYLQGKKEAFDSLVNTAREKTICLMCFENNPGECHRSVLADKLSAFGFSIEHI